MSRYSNQKRAKKAAASGKPAARPDAMTDVRQRKESMNAAILQSDPALFADHLVGWLEATAYMRSRAAAAQSKDPIAALGSAIPQFGSADFDKPQLRSVADDAVFAFCIVCALRSNAAAVDQLEALLTKRFGADFPGILAFGCCRKGIETGEALDDAVGIIVEDMLDDKAFDPRDIWHAGVRLLEKSRKSNFVQELIGVLAKWHRDRWGQIITQQLFNLTRPRATVPPIEDALRDDRNDQSFIAKLLIAATGAVDLGFDEAYGEHLQNIARRS